MVKDFRFFYKFNCIAIGVDIRTDVFYPINQLGRDFKTKKTALQRFQEYEAKFFISKKIEFNNNFVETAAVHKLSDEQIVYETEYKHHYVDGIKKLSSFDEVVHYFSVYPCKN